MLSSSLLTMLKCVACPNITSNSQPATRRRLNRAPKPDHNRRLRLSVLRVFCCSRPTPALILRMHGDANGDRGCPRVCCGPRSQVVTPKEGLDRSVADCLAGTAVQTGPSWSLLARNAATTTNPFARRCSSATHVLPVRESVHRSLRFHREWRLTVANMTYSRIEPWILRR